MTLPLDSTKPLGSTTDQQVRRAAQALIHGQLVAMPTETVYGLGADAANQQAVAAIYTLKGRPAGHPLIVHVSSLALALRWAELSPAALRLAQAFWPGPLTLICQRRPDMPAYACGGHATIGLRVPKHPVAQQLLQDFETSGGLGVAAPSANRFGRISPTRASHVLADFGDAAPLVLDGGPAQMGLESTIVDVSGEHPAILRPGAIMAEQIAAALELTDPTSLRVISPEPELRQPGSLPALANPSEQSPRPAAPGTLAAHYAPNTELILLSADAIAERARRLSEQSYRVVVYSVRKPVIAADSYWRAMPDNALELAQHLYDDLRQLDALALDYLLVQQPPSDQSAYAAVLDRLLRAQTGSAQSL